MYLLALAIGLCCSYVLLAYGFAWFFERPHTLSLEAARSVLVIAITAFAAFAISFHIDDKQLANRVLHLLGGGFAGFLVCTLAARDMQLGIGRVRFLVVAALIVSTMGVANELTEFFLQTYTPLLFSSSPLDTWLDLASNTAGIVLGALLLLPLVPRKARSGHENTPA